MDIISARLSRSRRLGPMAAIVTSPVVQSSRTVHVDAARQATRLKVGEVAETSAVVWMRVTRRAQRRRDGIVRRGAPRSLPANLKPEHLEGSAPGWPGRIRLRYGTNGDLTRTLETGWVDVSPKNDFTHQSQLARLTAATKYHFLAETAGPGGSPGYNPQYHKFHRVKGGFLWVNAKRLGKESAITFRLRAVDGEPLHRYSRARPAR